MWETLLYLFSDYTFQVVSLGAGVLGLISGLTGTYATLRKESLLGDALSHAALPGICLAFIFTGRRELIVLLIGAAFSGLLATGFINLIRDRSIVKTDSALSLTIASFFGLGLVLLTYIQRQPNANQAGLENFIYGQASSMLISEAQLMIGSGLFILVLVILFWKEFKVFTFDRTFTHTIGFSANVLNTILSSLIVLTVIIGLQAVGVILMSALLVGPAVASRQWSNRLSIVVILASFFGFISGVLGTVISSVGVRIPTGPTIVVVISTIVMFSLLFAPNRGLISRWIYQRRRRKSFKKQLEKKIERRKNYEYDS